MTIAHFILTVIYAIIISGALLALIGYILHMIPIVNGNAPLDYLFTHKFTTIGLIMTYGGLGVLIALLIIF